MPLGLSIGTVTVGGRLHVSYRYRHPQFDAEAATRFAAEYESTIEQFLGVAAADPPGG
jgi:hypothetical protein